MEPEGPFPLEEDSKNFQEYTFLPYRMGRPQHLPPRDRESSQVVELDQSEAWRTLEGQDGRAVVEFPKQSWPRRAADGR